MREIKIEINNAKIRSFTVDLSEDIPIVTAIIGLFMGEKQLTTFSLGTKSWNDKKFELPAAMIPPIKKMADELEKILVVECTKALMLLAYDTPNTPAR